MRWDRLFADLEGQAEDVALEERDALVSELRDEEWSRASWTSVLGGTVELDVRGVGRLTGEVGLVNETLVRLIGATTDHVVARAAVQAVHGGRREEPAGGLVGARLGWRQVLRGARDEGEPVRVVRTDEAVHEGQVDVVGEDFVRVRSGAGRGARRGLDQALTSSTSARVPSATSCSDNAWSVRAYWRRM